MRNRKSDPHSHAASRHFHHDSDFEKCDLKPHTAKMAQTSFRLIWIGTPKLAEEINAMWATCVKSFNKKRTSTEIGGKSEIEVWSQRANNRSRFNLSSTINNRGDVSVRWHSQDRENCYCCWKICLCRKLYNLKFSLYFEFPPLLSVHLVPISGSATNCFA